MKTFAKIAIAALAGLTVIGSAEAMPVAPQPMAVRAIEAPVVKAAVVVTRTVVRRRPMMMRRRPMMMMRRRPMVTRVIRRVTR